MSDVESDFGLRRRFTDLNQERFSLLLGSYRCEMLGWGYLGERWWRNYLHLHSFYEVCCAFGGTGTFRINGVDYQIQAGDVFVAKPTELHEIVSAESTSTPLGIYFWSYSLRPNILQRTHQVDEETHEIDALLDAFSQSRCWVSRYASSSILSLCQLLTEEVITRAPGYRQTCEGLIAKLIIDTARSVVPIEVPNPRITQASHLQSLTYTPTQQIFKQIEQYLRDNFARPITIRDVAAQVHLSERHISRLFQQATGKTIKDYVHVLRMDAAVHQLLNSAVAIKAIGEFVGLPDVQHFTTVFKRHTGLTPAAFRKQHGTRFADPKGPKHVEEG